MQNVREFTYQKLTPEEQKSRGILGRLVGVIADTKHETRNGRLYTEELWDKVFKNPIMQEKLQNKCVFGELGHPTDRTETDMEKIAINLAEEPKKMPDGTIQGVFDILDTPNGRILKTLCDYGCNIGVSSRGTGDVVEDWSGKAKVDPNTYDCECWDAVLLPAVKSARPQYVHESLETGNKLKIALTEDLKKASPNDKRVMEETLKALNIDLIDKALNEANTRKSGVKNNSEAQPTAADDIGAMVESLQKSLRESVELQKQVAALQKKLSVCNAKEAELMSALQQEKAKNAKLAEAVEAANSKVSQLNEQVSRKTTLLEKQQLKVDSLSRKLQVQTKQQSTLTESVDSSDKKVQVLTEQLAAEKEESSKQIAALQESLEAKKQDVIIVTRQCEQKVEKANRVVEHYKNVAHTAINRYIESKAKMYGVKPVDITSRLTENYSFKDIDQVCEQLGKSQLKIGALPFSVKDNGKTMKVQVKESKEPIKPRMKGFDDDIDDQLLFLARK